MKRIFRLAALVVALARLSLAAAEPKIAWTFSGPANPAYEWVTMTATGEGLVFTVVKGQSWNFRTEHGTFTEAGSEVVALDLKTGQRRWSFRTKFPVFSPLLYLEGKLVIHDGYGDLFCLDASTGNEVWKVEQELHPGPWDQMTLPSGKGDFIYLREEGDLVCRSLKDGKVIWRTPISAVSNRRVYAAIAGDKLALSTASDDFMIFGARGGGVVWKATPGWLDETLVATEEVALFSNSDGLSCYALADGKEIWGYSTPSRKPSQQANQAVKYFEAVWRIENARPLACRPERLFVYQKRVMEPQAWTGFEIACMDIRNRNLYWTYTLWKPFSGFSLAGQKAVVVEGNLLRVISLQDGKVLWEFQVEGEGILQGQALVTGGRVLVVGAKGLYCIETGDPTLTGWPQSAGSARRAGSG